MRYFLSLLLLLLFFSGANLQKVNDANRISARKTNLWKIKKISFFQEIRFIFTNFTYLNDAEYLESNASIDASRQVINVEMTLKKTVYAPRIGVFLRSYFNHRTTFKFNKTAVVCSADPRHLANPVIIYTFKKFEKLSNFRPKCPFLPGHYFMRKLGFKPGELPFLRSFFETNATWSLTVTFYEYLVRRGLFQISQYFYEGFASH